MDTHHSSAEENAGNHQRRFAVASQNDAGVRQRLPRHFRQGGPVAARGRRRHSRPPRLAGGHQTGARRRQLHRKQPVGQRSEAAHPRRARAGDERPELHRGQVGS